MSEEKTQEPVGRNWQTMREALRDTILDLEEERELRSIRDAESKEPTL